MSMALRRNSNKTINLKEDLSNMMVIDENDDLELEKKSQDLNYNDQNDKDIKINEQYSETLNENIVDDNKVEYSNFVLKSKEINCEDNITEKVDLNELQNEIIKEDVVIIKENDDSKIN